MTGLRRIAAPMLTVLVGFASGCSDAEPPTAPESASSAHARQAPAHAGRAPRTLDDEFVRLAGEIPGFGGYSHDGETLVVHLTDLGESARARAVLGRTIAAAGGRVDAVRFVKGEFPFTDLKTWSDRLLPVLGEPGVVFTDIDEARNRITVGVEDSGVRARMLSRVQALGVPGAAVAVEIVDPIRFMSTLRDYQRPGQGGLQIAYSNDLCTLGFNAMRSDSVPGFVTNSHCTDVRASVDGTSFYQPIAGISTYFIGTEVLDPPFFTIVENAACPLGRQCRYSDAAFAVYDASVQSDLAGIARTTSRGKYSGSFTIDAANPRFSITSKRYSSPVSGMRMEKVGKTTGWTTGLITHTCVNANPDASSITLLCQYFVDAGAGHGDSGSPVFYWWDPTEVTLFGILWGGNDAGTVYTFSWIGHVEDELGSLTVFPLSGGGGGGEPLPPPDGGGCTDPSQVICD